MGPLAIASLIAMAAGTAMQYKATNDAAKRQAEETRRALARQSELQQQAEKKALGQAEEFRTDDRVQAQAQIEDQMAQEFLQPAQSAQQINASASTTQGDVSADYTAAKARSDAAVLKSNEVLARLMAKTGSANRLRNNEAIRVADTAAGIDRLGNFSRGQMGADQIAIQAAGRPNAGLQLAGGLLSAAGMYGLASGAGSAATGASGGSGVGATASTSGNFSAPIAANTTGQVGARIPASFSW